MAFRHGRNADVSVSGNLLGQFCDTIDFNDPTDISIIEVFKTASKAALTGQYQASLDLKGSYDPTVTTGPDAVLSGTIQNDAVALIYYPGGNLAGQVSYAFNGVLKEYKVDSKTNGQVAFSASFMSTGTITRTAL